MHHIVLKTRLLPCILSIAVGAVLTLLGFVLVRKHRTNTSGDDVNWYHDQSLKIVITGIALIFLGIAGLKFWNDQSVG